MHRCPYLSVPSHSRDYWSPYGNEVLPTSLVDLIEKEDDVCDDDQCETDETELEMRMLWI